MRKKFVAVLLGMAILALGCKTALAQRIVDFEDLTLAPGSAYNGSDHSGGFESGGTGLNNFYDDTYGPYWEGWAYSNFKNNTTPGPDKQYAAYAPYSDATGAGSRGSANYALGFTLTFALDAPIITLPDGYSPTSVRVANSTYTAYSMLLGGPQGAKRFGGESGTDPDFLQLTITGKDAQGHDVGHVDVKLADYTSANSLLDYVANGWQNVNLSALQGARQLWFGLTSSDNNTYGMLTPAFFALDDLSLSQLPGDLSDDGLVDISDIQSIASNWLQTGPTGDANGDGVVDVSDVQVLAVNWQQSVGSQASQVVPEPAAVTLAMLAVLGLAGYRRATKLRV